MQETLINAHLNVWMQEQKPTLAHCQINHKQGKEDDWNSKEGLWGTQVLNQKDEQIVHYQFSFGQWAFLQSAQEFA